MVKTKAQGSPYPLVIFQCASKFVICIWLSTSICIRVYKKIIQLAIVSNTNRRDANDRNI